MLLRNPEVKLYYCLYLAFSVAACAAAAVWEPFFALYVFGVCLMGGALTAAFTKKRYDRLNRLSMQLDEILHGDERMTFIPDEEGELAVLGSKIYKMTIRLRDQAEELRKEKCYLQESLADISHQVRTPLTSIYLLLQRLQEEEQEERRSRITWNINRLLARTEWLIASLLKIAKLESGTIKFKYDCINAWEMVREAAEPLEIPMEVKGQHLKLIGKKDVQYCGDFLWSVEALGNLLKNCMEHTADNGVITVAFDENPIYTEIQVEDSGSGFIEEDLPRLFERFYRGKDSAGDSVGIGLSLAGMIVKKQNGTIQVSNKEEGGAQFLLRFYKGII